MHVLCLIPHPPEGASGRCRILQYLPWLDRQGITYEVRPFMSPALFRLSYRPGRLAEKLILTAAALARRARDVARAATADVVVIHREATPLGTALCERLIARQGKPIVFDFDDAIYLPHASHANAWTRAFRRAGKTSTLIGLSSQVIAGNAVLAAYARRHHDAVTVIPTSVDTARFALRPDDDDPRGRLVIGWTGSPTTAEYLAPLQHVFAQLAQRFPHVRIRVIGADHVPLQLPNLEVQPWRLEDEPAHLQRFDIGVMPMPNDEWARGKCGYKALLYMSVGVPVVASPVGVNCDIVQDGINGLLPADEAGWMRALTRLIEDAPLRRRLGLAGRATVEAGYSVAVNAPMFVRVLEHAALGRPVPVLLAAKSRASVPVGR